MDLGLKGKTALVTGASRGIGKAIALALAAEGVDVATASRSTDPRTTGEIEALGVRCLPLEVDVASEDQVEAMVAETISEFGALDFFVNNAGGTWHEAVTRISTSNWERTLTTNLTACMWACRAVSSHMVSRRSGSILIVASTIQYMPGYGEAAYRTSKLGLRSLAETLALELGPWNIRVNLLSPGLFPTQLGANLKVSVRDPVLGPRLLEAVPLRRLGNPDECGAAAAFLLSDVTASYITGAEIIVDGGFSLRPLVLVHEAEAVAMNAPR